MITFGQGDGKKKANKQLQKIYMEILHSTILDLIPQKNLAIDFNKAYYQDIPAVTKTTLCRFYNRAIYEKISKYITIKLLLPLEEKLKRFPLEVAKPAALALTLDLIEEKHAFGHWLNEILNSYHEEDPSKLQIKDCYALMNQYCALKSDDPISPMILRHEEAKHNTPDTIENVPHNSTTSSHEQVSINDKKKPVNDPRCPMVVRIPLIRVDALTKTKKGNKETVGKVHDCQICHAFSHRDIFIVTRHIRTCKRKSEMFLIQCKDCKKSYANQRTLQKHYRLKRCNPFNKEIMKKSESLRKDILYEPLEEKKYRCPNCKKYRGPNRYSVTRHMDAYLKKQLKQKTSG